MLFDWLVTGQVVASNPAHAVRGPRHSVKKGSTTVMSSEDTSAFLKTIDTSHVVGLRDRALIAVMVFAFARVSAVVGLKVEDYFPIKKRWWLRLREKGGKVNEMGCHHKLEEYLDAYIAAAGIARDKKGPLFRAAIGRTKKLSPTPMSRVDAWVHGASSRERCGSGSSHRQSLVPRHRHFGLHAERRRYYDCAAHGRTRQYQNHASL
jgi:integrase/recombinase XerD